MPNDPRASAQRFLRRNRDLLTIPDPRTDFVHRRSRRQGDRAIERFEQTYDGLPVFGSHVTVQLDGAGHVEAPGEREYLDLVEAAFVDNEYRLRSTLVELVASPAFRFVGEQDG